MKLNQNSHFCFCAKCLQLVKVMMTEINKHFSHLKHLSALNTLMEVWLKASPPSRTTTRPCEQRTNQLHAVPLASTLFQMCYTS